MKYIGKLPFSNRQFKVTWTTTKPYYPELSDMHGNLLFKSDKEWIKAFRRLNKGITIENETRNRKDLKATY